MKPRIITTAAVLGLLVALAAGDVFAAGRGNGGNGGGGAGGGMQARTHTQTRTQSAAAGTSATRPAGSQRRDGTMVLAGAIFIQGAGAVGSGWYERSSAEDDRTSLHNF